MMVEARFYKKLEEGVCRCETCPRTCIIKPGEDGYCLSRHNDSGLLISSLYGNVVANHMDPIEKKPLYHFLPGSKILSIGTVGCNLGCLFCQNWELSRGNIRGRQVDREKIIDLAFQERSVGIAYTYNEPLVWYEYVYDCCKLAHEKGLKNVFVTNGTLNAEPFDELLPYIDALNVDLKGDKRFYKELCDSSRQPVLRNIKKAAENAHVEITNLLVTGENDSAEQITELVDFVASVNPKIPLHFSRYFPNYRFDAPATPESSLTEAFRIASEKLEFVYLGNIHTSAGNNTICPNCQTVNVKRSGYSTKVLAVDEKGCCSKCGHDLYMVACG